MSTAGLDGPLTDALVGTRRFFTRSEVSADKRSIHATGRARPATRSTGTAGRTTRSCAAPTA